MTAAQDWSSVCLFLPTVIHLLLTFFQHPAAPSVPASESLGLSSASLGSLYSIAALIFSLLVQWLSELMGKKKRHKHTRLWLFKLNIMNGDRNNFQLKSINTILETIPYSCKPSDLQTYLKQRQEKIVFHFHLQSKLSFTLSLKWVTSNWHEKYQTLKLDDFFSKYFNSKEKLTGLFPIAITQLPVTEKKEKYLKTLQR